MFYAADGLGTVLDTAIEPYTQFAGFLDSRTDSLKSTLTRIADDRELLDYRVSQIELSLRAKYAAMDTAVSKFTFTGQYIAQQMAALSGNNDN